MQKIKKSLKLLAVLFVLAVFWLFYFVLKFTYGTPENNNLNYIPKNSTAVIAFNGDLALKSVLSDFLSSQDESLLKKMNESRSDLKKNSGIEILSDFVIVYFNKNGLDVTGLLVNLNSEKDFKANFKDQVIASNSSVGLLILNEIQDNKIKLRHIANSTLKNANTLYKNKLSPKRKNESLISFWTKTESSNKWSCSNLMINGSKIIIDGTMVNVKPRNTSLSQLKESNTCFHASINGIIPDALGDSIVKFLQIEDNNLLGVSANYRSLKIEQEKSFEIVPDGDFVFNFSKPIEINKLLKSAIENEIIVDLTSKQYNYGGKLFYYCQLTDKSFYIGRTPTSEIQLENNSAFLSIHGTPNYLSKIEGSSLMLRLMNIFPAYRMGKGLTKSIQSIDIDVLTASAATVKIKGEIQFQKGKYASIELIRNLLELR